MKIAPLTVLAAFSVAAALSIGNAHAVLAVYTWDTAVGSVGGTLVGGNDGWTFGGGEGDGSNDFVFSTGAPAPMAGNFYQSTDASEPGNGDSIYTRTNDGTFSFSIEPNAQTIILSTIVRHSGEIAPTTDIARFGLSASGTALFDFGNGAGGWAFRDFATPGNSMVANGTGDLELDGTLRTFKLTATIDMTPVGTNKTIDLTVENLTDGGSQQIFDDETLSLPAIYVDPSTWDGMFIRVNGISDPASIDTMTISSVVPEPSRPLLALAGLAVVLLRRRR